MMSCAASPLILVPDRFCPFPILSTLEILSGIAFDIEQIHLAHILRHIIPWPRLCALLRHRRFASTRRSLPYEISTGGRSCAQAYSFHLSICKRYPALKLNGGIFNQAGSFFSFYIQDLDSDLIYRLNI